MYGHYAEIRVENLGAGKRPGRPGRVQGNHLHGGGPEAYKWLKYESGTHRVQRVPATEANGHIHTSTATVAVLPKRRTRPTRSRSTPPTCAWTCTAPPARAGST